MFQQSIPQPFNPSVSRSIAWRSVLAGTACVAAAITIQFFTASKIAGVSALLLSTSAVGMIAFIAARRGSPNVKPTSFPAGPVRGNRSRAEGLNGALMSELKTLRATKDELIEARRAAEAAVLAKGEFLATMSHEIRTPLNGILPLLDLVLSTKLDEEQKEQLSTAYRSSRELLRIVNNILDYSKIESGHVEFESANLNVRDLIESVGKLMERSAAQKSVNLTWHVDGAFRHVARGDSLRLKQVLTNLVGNAIKFTDRGSISISVGLHSESRSHRTLMFSVKDTGVGISPDTAKRLFQPFSQADASTTRIYGGTGLGLAICRQLVEAMGGQIGVSSEVGRGSTFWFTVPLMRAIGEGPQQQALEGMRGLVLCRDLALLQVVSKRLNSLGIQLSPVNTTLEALAALRNAATIGANPPDLVVIEFSAFRRTLLSVVRGVVNDDALAGVRIVVLGSREQIPEEVLNCRTRLIVLSRDATEQQFRGSLEGLWEGDDGEENEVAVTAAGPIIEVREKLASGADFAGKRVLLVDDVPINRKVGERLLQKLGMIVDLAENGREALERIERTSYDIVLMDCQMPEVDGYTATRIRRELENEGGLRHLPIVAVTANAMQDDRAKCLAAGMDDYISKPIERGVLERTLEQWLVEVPDTAAEARRRAM